MSDDNEKDHGEPPEFAKWLIWLFRPMTWKNQPIIAIIVTVIALFTVYSGFNLLFDNDDDPTAADAGNGTATPEKAHDVQITDIRFLNTDPEGEVAPAPMFKRLQLTFTNKGTSTSVVTKCSLKLIDSWFVSPITGVGGIVEPSATFRIYVPPSLDPGVYTTAESFLVNLAPDETESVELIIDYPPLDEPTAVEINSTFWSQKDEAAFLGGPVFLAPILLANIELQLDSEDVAES
ncbi:MAG TPA: hypothetical protein DDW52_24660, partial [Planctomycetaceae bacterium]|nr:hypothetical protein [Planctomycetaceae bacterium]